MSTHPPARHKPGSSPASGLFRRRVIFELTEDQLPLLDAAQARHGSKRAALLAALHAETHADELQQRVDAAERALADHAAPVQRDAGRTHKHAAKAERDAETTRDALTKAEAQLEAQRRQATAAQRAIEEDRDALAEALEARDEEIEELTERAFDHLYCARCATWSPPSDWGWRDAPRGGHYAFHHPCGDHDSNMLGPPSSRLGYRAPE